MGDTRHGGDLSEARRCAPHVPWLDLSTGINPHAYPAELTVEALTRLPQADALERLIAAARSAYRVPPASAVVAAPGTQAILQWLPQLWPARSVAVVEPTYGEHAATWGAVARVSKVASPCDHDGADVLVVVNPNNPDGRRIDAATLADIAGHRAARSRDRLTVVDEAFGDLEPGNTVAGAPNTVVLRSFGKFYGLAGVRLGFAITDGAAAARLLAALGPWAVSGPALALGERALCDVGWAERMRARLAQERVALDRVLAAYRLGVAGGTDLYRLVVSEHAGRWHRELEGQGILTRAFADRPDALRIGAPGDALGRLEAALGSVRIAA